MQPHKFMPTLPRNMAVTYFQLNLRNPGQFSISISMSTFSDFERRYCL